MGPGGLPRVASNTAQHSHQRPWRTRGVEERGRGGERGRKGRREGDERRE